MKRISFYLLVSLFFFSSLVIAEPAKKFYGTWQLVSVTSVDGKKQQTSFPYGKHPSGYLNYLPNGYMSVLLVSNDKARKITSYVGTYTVNKGYVTHHIKVAWDEAWVGTDKIRYYQFKNNQLILTTPADKNNYSILVWKKVSSFKS